MKNPYAVFLNIVAISIIAVISIIQIYSLSLYDINQIMSTADSYGIMIQSFRKYQSITMFLGILTITLLFSKEGINRGLKRKAYLDITGIMNKHACLEQMNMLNCNASTLNVGFAIFDLNNLKKVNDFYGHEEGDKLIQNFVFLLRQASDKRFFIGRFGGDEFMVIIQNCSQEIMENYLENMKKLTANFNRGLKIQLSYACGYAISTKEHYYLTEELLNEADKKMYENKKMMKSSTLYEPEQLSKILDADRVNALDKDDLTGVFEYDVFVAAVKKVMGIFKSDAKLAIVCSDLYNFRHVNDFYGYKKGNILLKQFAEELSKQPFCLCVHRIYSDNFAFLADVSNMSEAEAMEMISLWNTRFTEKTNDFCKGSRLIVKSGIYFISQQNEPVESMLNKATCAHKLTKTAHYNMKSYTEELGLDSKKRSQVINSFENALEHQEFKVYIQPQVLCSDKSICGAEALIRWPRNQEAMIYPDEFIPVLEQTGDIIAMDFYVYEKVFSYLYKNLLNKKPMIPLSVNVSRIHLDKIDHFIEGIKTLQEKYPISSNSVIFELTESAYIQEICLANDFIDKLHSLGFRVSMDDYGSGYSSLKALQTIPFDEIKFDRDFLNHVKSDSDSTILVQMLNLIKSTGANVVCEGVETKEHVQMLEKSGCDTMQGYYYYKPFPLEDLDKLTSLYP